jgi:hypothetical protein
MKCIDVIPCDATVDLMRYQPPPPPTACGKRLLWLEEPNPVHPIGPIYSVVLVNVFLKSAKHFLFHQDCPALEARRLGLHKLLEHKFGLDERRITPVTLSSHSTFELSHPAALLAAGLIVEDPDTAWSQFLILPRPGDLRHRLRGLVDDARPSRPLV